MVEEDKYGRVEERNAQSRRAPCSVRFVLVGHTREMSISFPARPPAGSTGTALLKQGT